MVIGERGESVQYLFRSFNARFSEVAGLLEEVGFHAAATLCFGDGGRTQAFRKTVPDDRSSNVETSFAKLLGCSRHGQDTASCGAETKKLCRRCTDVLALCGTTDA